MYSYLNYIEKLNLYLEENDVCVHHIHQLIRSVWQLIAIYCKINTPSVHFLGKWKVLIHVVNTDRKKVN
jgi:hypothetical protein